MVSQLSAAAGCAQARDQASTALAEAQGKVFKLEVQVAEGQKQAAHIAELEKEVSRYRQGPALRAAVP